MAREIIILGVQNQPDGSVIVSGVFWLIAPAALVVPLPNFVSKVPLASAVTWGITTGASSELAALQAGTTVEQGFASGQLSGLTVAQIQAGLIAAYTNAQTALNNEAPASHWIGASYNGTAWTAAP